MKYILIKVPFYIVLSTFSTSLLFSHGGEKHEKKKPTEEIIQNKIQTVEEPTLPIKKIDYTTPSLDKEKIKATVYKEINTAYITKIKPIFEKKCFDCHGTLKNKPWYYDLPLVSYIIQKDIEEAKEHMDMTQDFPFVSHDSPYNDLKSIRDIGLKGGMPPLKYIIGHWDASLTNNEKKVFIQWSTQAMQKIKDNNIDTKAKLSH